MFLLIVNFKEQFLAKVISVLINQNFSESFLNFLNYFFNRYRRSSIKIFLHFFWTLLCKNSLENLSVSKESLIYFFCWVTLVWLILNWRRSFLWNKILALSVKWTSISLHKFLDSQNWWVILLRSYHDTWWKLWSLYGIRIHNRVSLLFWKKDMLLLCKLLLILEVLF
jgi:hypothetical protein